MGYRYLVGPDDCLDPADRGLAYGDGLFETIACRGGRILRFELHYDRLSLGCARLQLPVPDKSELEGNIAAVAGSGSATIKLILSRGTGPRGYAPPQSPNPVAILSAAVPTASVPQDLTVVTLAQRLGENEQLAGIKHLCRLEQVLGQLELATGDAGEGLMLSTGGSVISGTSRNLFALYGQRLVTPDLTLAGISGTMRRFILERAEQHGLQPEVAVMNRTDLDDADELFMTNALVGIQSVAQLDGKAFARQDTARRLRDVLGLAIDV